MSKPKKPSWAGFQNSGFYNASGVAALQSQLGGYSTDQAVLNQQALAALQPGYNSNVLAANQQLESVLGGYENQLSGLGQSFDMQRRVLNSQYDQSGSQALNQIGKRGMGRSSLVGTTLASIEGGRGQALTDVALKQADAYGDIRNNMELARNQNAATLRGYAENLTAQAQANATQQYNTNLAAQANINFQIAQLLQAGYQAYVNQINKQNKDSRTSRNSGGTNRTSPPPPPPPNDFIRYNNTQGGSGAAGWFNSGVR